MIVAFPGFPAMNQGEPTMQDFFRNTSIPSSMCTVVRVLPQPTKSHTCVSLPASVYAIHTQELYPDNVAFPGDVCDFSGIAENNLTAEATKYTEWQCIMK